MQKIGFNLWNINPRERQTLMHSAAIVESSDDAIIGKTLDGTITSWNQGAQNLFGHTKAEIIGKPVSCLLLPDHPDEVPQLLQQIARGEKTSYLETVRVCKDGRRIAVSLLVLPIKDNSGRIMGASVIMRDISEHKKMEQDLRTASQYARSLFEANPDPMLILDSEGRITDVNQAAEASTGCPRNNLIGSRFTDYFTEPDRARGVYQQAFEQGALKDYPLTLRQASGRTVNVVFNVSAIHNGNGQMRGILAAARDVTERQQMEAQIRDSEARYRMLVDNLPQKLFLKDRNLNYLSVNAKMALDLNLPPEEVIGKTDFDFFPPNLAEKYRADDIRIMQSGQVESIDERYVEDGKTTFVQTIKIPIRDEGILGIFWDITERKLIEEELQSHRQHLETMVDQRTAELTRALQDIQEASNILVSSAGQILTATTQVAAGAIETATAVSQTTTTIEEVRQTALVSTEKARSVSENAQKTVQVAKNGQKAVDELIEGILTIQQRMESIADSIIRLSEQSQTIGDIIATVNDIADQSNLLAVNAAIEAARAGDQGKGFGVVAREIKNLAEQSKQATARVRTILNEVQKGTAAAVMATEQGNKAVEAGTRQSATAGESIKTLTDSVLEAANAATQIAASIRQQTAGLEQVVSAMESIKQTSNQNAASTRQVETAAGSLHELARKLKELLPANQT